MHKRRHHTSLMVLTMMKNVLQNIASGFTQNHTKYMQSNHSISVISTTEQWNQAQTQTDEHTRHTPITVISE